MSCAPSVPRPEHDDCFQTLADGAPVMIWMSGLDMGCFYFNRAWLDYRGRTLEQEAGNGWAEGVHPDDLQRCVNHYVSCFERRVAFAMSYRLLDANGKFQWIMDRGAPHFLPDGAFLGFFGGCAVLGDAAIERHQELGGTMARMRDFARRVAAEPVGALQSTTTISPTRAAQDLETVRLQHAAANLEKLAADMTRFASIAPGECLPTAK